MLRSVPSPRRAARAASLAGSWLLVLSVVSCARGRARGDELPPGRAQGPVVAERSAMPVATASPVAPAPSASDALDSPGAFGSTCAEGDEDPRVRLLLCTATGGLAGRFLDADACYPPPDAEVLFALKHVGFHATGFELALRGEEVWLKRTECAACRRILGWAFHGWLDRLSAEHRSRIQAEFGLTADLGSASALRTWARSAAGQRELTSLATAPRSF